MRTARNAELDRLPIGNIPPMPPEVARAILDESESDEGYVSIEDMVGHEPDEDFYRSVSIDQMRVWAHEMIERLYKLPR
jgi:hypothetical protein